MATKPTNPLLQHVRKMLTAHEIAQRSDRELLRRFAQERDEAAFAMLVRRHGPMVLQSCQRVLHNWHDAEDGFQATFLVLARKAASHRWKASIASWLYLVAHRLALNIRASRDRRLPHDIRPVEHSSEDPLAAASSRELCHVLDEELSRLPEKYRAPLVLCSLNRFTREEAARQLGWSLATLRRRLEQGRALLRQRLEHRGLPLSAIFAAVLGAEGVTQPTVPFGLAQSMVQMGMQTALERAVPTALVSLRAAALAEGVLKAMCFTKLKIGLMVVLAMCIVGVGGGMLARQVLADKPVAGNDAEPKPATNSAESTD